MLRSALACCCVSPRAPCQHATPQPPVRVFSNGMWGQSYLAKAAWPVAHSTFLPFFSPPLVQSSQGSDKLQAGSLHVLRHAISAGHICCSLTPLQPHARDCPDRHAFQGAICGHSLLLSPKQELKHMQPQLMPQVMPWRFKI